VVTESARILAGLRTDNSLLTFVQKKDKTPVKSVQLSI
jgi:hypothetical protein